MRWGWILVCVLASSSWGAESLDPLSLSLTDALRRAKACQMDILISKERVRQAIARESQATSFFWPHILGNANQSRQKINPRAMGIPIPGPVTESSPFHSYDARIQVIQSLLDFSALQRWSVARADIAASKAEADKIQQDILALVSSLYLQARRGSEALEIAQMQVRRDEAHVRLAKTRLENGTDAPVNIVAEEAALERSRYRVKQLEAAEIEKRLDLVTALDLPVDRAILFADEKSDSQLIPPDLDHFPEWLSRHPEWIWKKEFVAMREAQKRSEEAEYLPKVSAIGNYGVNGQEYSQSQEVYSMGIQVTVPIFEGGLRQAKIRETESRIQESKAVLKKTEEELQARMELAKATVLQEAEGVKTARLETEWAGKQKMLARERLRNGMGSLLELNDSNTSYAETYDRQLEATERYHLAVIALAHALGNMDALANDQ